MATKDNAPSVQSRSTTTPTGEESVTPVSQPSGVGELSASMVTETDRRLEVIQRAQVGSLMGANKTKEPQEKTPKEAITHLGYSTQEVCLEMWLEIETSPGMYSTLRKTLTALILQLTLLITPIQVVLACTWMWLAICWPFMGRRLTLEQASSMIKVS